MGKVQKVLGLGLISTTDQPTTAEEAGLFRSLTAQVSDHWSIETADLVSRVLIGKAFLQAHPTFLGEWTKAVSNYALKDMPALGRALVERSDHTQVAAQLGVPTVVIHGEDDAIPIETAVQVASRIPLPNVHILCHTLVQCDMVFMIGDFCLRE